MIRGRENFDFFYGFVWIFSTFKGTVVYQKYFVRRFIEQSNHHVRTEKIREKKQLATYFLLCTGIHLQIWHPFSLPPISYYVFVEFTLFVISYRTNTILSSIKRKFLYFLGAYVVIALCNEAYNKILLVHNCPFESTEESYKSVKK